MANKALGPIAKAWQDPYLRFIILFLSLSIGFYYFNIAYIGLTAKGGAYIPFLDKYLNYINWWRNFTIESTATILEWLGYRVRTSDFRLTVFKIGGISLVYSCLGYGIMGVFAAFVLTFPERINKRYLFLFIGLVCIQLLNTIRLILLSLYWNPKKPLIGIDHHDLFNYIVYAFLIVLTYSWLKISRTSEKK